MSGHKNTLKGLKPLNDDQLKRIKGGLAIISLPGKDLKAGNWTDIDLRITSPNKKGGSFSFRSNNG